MKTLMLILAATIGLSAQPCDQVVSPPDRKVEAAAQALIGKGAEGELERR